MKKIRNFVGILDTFLFIFQFEQTVSYLVMKSSLLTLREFNIHAEPNFYSLHNFCRILVIEILFHSTGLGYLVFGWFVSESESSTWLDHYMVRITSPPIPLFCGAAVYGSETIPKCENL